MSSFNINQVPDNIPGALAWCIEGIKVLFRRTASSSGGGSGTTTVTPLFDHYTSVGNVGTSETDLYSDTIAANTLTTNGDKLQIIYGGTYTGALANKTIKVYFAGVPLLNTGGLNFETGTWQVSCTIIRSASDRCRYTIELHANDVVFVYAGSFGNTNQTTPIDLSVDNVLKVTGTSDGATDQVFATMGTVTWISHA